MIVPIRNQTSPIIPTKLQEYKYSKSNYSKKFDSEKKKKNAVRSEITAKNKKWRLQKLTPKRRSPADSRPADLGIGGGNNWGNEEDYLCGMWS